MRPHREPYLQRARERHLRRARATHARTGKGPVPRARAPRQGWWRAACPVGRDESEAAGQKRAEWIRAYSLARLSLSLCMWGSRRSTCAGTRERNAAGCGSAAQRQCSGGRKDISDATSARHGWRGAHAESRSSRRAGGSLDSLHKAGACLGCPLSGHNQTSTKQNTEKVQRCSGYN
jgi:hypothetical protein